MCRADIDLCLFLAFVIHKTGLAVNMTYLQFKWTEMFFLLDANKDNMLDTTDVEISTDYLINVNNLTEEEVWRT